MFQAYLDQSLGALTLLRQDDRVLSAVNQAATAILDAFAVNAPLLVCGNGGSAADAQHIAGELVGRYKRERRALPCIALGTDIATLTALGNDYGYEDIFSRQVQAYVRPGAILWGISTSGNSANVLKAFHMAKSLNMTTLAMTGESGGKLKEIADILINVPSQDTPIIQQLHQIIYHHLCERIETQISLDDLQKIA